MHANLDALGEVDRDMRAIEAERVVLAARLADLEQASVRARQLSAMRERIAALEAAVAPAENADELAGRLAAALALLQELTDEQRAALGPQLDRALADARTAGEHLLGTKDRKKELDCDFERLTDEMAEVTTVIKRELPALAQWRNADAAIADALIAAGHESGTTPQRLRTALAELGERMKAIDDELGPLYTAYIAARDEALAIRALSTPAS
jgi:hypothetical protein